ncbi:MAG: nitroreductase family protein [Ilumatobacteraceae bacterium]|jgi:nitroreductase|nr:nitroreductase family protein [Ilumatobacteraceae bacterium]MBJ7508259.1 nitroreductase family protein [Ilumatobacteraceae bacterium]MCX6533632.1 nitroreductase family protein [Actinomycetota bacterium]
MTIDHIATDKLLTTTRSVRKRLDLTREVEPQVIADCIDIAMQAPTGTNAQNWAFVVITDPAKKKFIADAYRSGGAMMAGSGYPPPLEPGDPREHVMPKVMESAGYLGEILEQVPVFVIACVRGRVESVPMVIAQASTYGSILPAAWSFMLALRSRGLGTAWTTIHLFQEQAISELLGIPDDWTQTVLFPVAYYTGDDFKPAHRLPSDAMTHWDSWGSHR